ncbi:MAG: 16S rRNA (adenine1518-N6/adenine1519-N6)-dimethyltransferase [Patiriisocius sp.]|jgi:16S rRNA (adenine1518-N6/adenine1519-N6)-dimethyltransferase
MSFQHKKSLGQHFLTSNVVPTWMCDAADLSARDFVLEIGPGTGVLTKEILARGATVLALEADTRAIEVLEETFATEISDGTLILRHCDVRTLDLTAVPEISTGSFKVVANIPYYLSGLLFRMFLESPVQPTDLVYLVQKEVAKRATTTISTGGKESLLSLSVNVYGTGKYVKTVTRGHFTPPPKVDSGIIVIRNIGKHNFTNIEESLFFNVLHIGFGQKRKQLLGNLTKHYDRELLINIFSTIDLSVSIRAEDVPLPMWLTLVEKLIPHS